METGDARDVLRMLPPSGGDGVLLSSRVRIARNLPGKPFPFESSGREARKLAGEILEAFAALFGNAYRAFAVNDIPRLDRRVMVERHLMSPEFARGGPGRVILFLPRDNVQVLINEEDHLRIQIIGGGYDFLRMWETLDRYDDALNRRLDFAFHGAAGYLTSCPTNVGTGLRVSVLLSLPALAAAGGIEPLFNALGRIGALIRGIHGEGSGSMGNLYQIATGSGEGKDERTLIGEFETLVATVLEREEKALSRIDAGKVARSLRRTLAAAAGKKRLRCREAFRALSLLRLAEKLGIISRSGKLDALFLLMLPAGIRKEAALPMTGDEVDAARAVIIRRETGGIHV